MTVLAIDTSRRGGCMAVLCDDDGEILLARHATSVSEALADAIAGHSLDAVVVAVGPGSYTGVRAGMAAALGIAQARDIPLYGIGSLEVVAHGTPASMAAGIAVVAAGRGALYAAGFTRLADELWTAPPRWVAAMAIPVADGDAVAGFEPVTVPGALMLPEPARALAAAARVALRRPPLERLGLSAHHVTVFEQSW